MEDLSLIAEMERLRSALRDAQKDGLLDYKALSGKIGRNPTYIQQFVTKKSPRILHSHLADEVWRYLKQIQATGRPAPRASHKARTKEEILDLLRRIEDLPEGALEPVYAVIAGFVEQVRASRQQSNAGGQSEPSSPRHVRAPS